MATQQTQLKIFNPEEPINLADARATLSSAASVAADTIPNWFNERGNTPSSKSYLMMIGKLNSIAKEAYQSKNDSEWASTFPGGSAYAGSARLAVLVAAYGMINRILRFDKMLPKGVESDLPGTLTEEGLTKLVNQLSLGLAGLNQLLPKNDGKYAPSHNVLGNMRQMNQTLVKIFNTQPGNEALTFFDVADFSPGGRSASI